MFCRLFVSLIRKGVGHVPKKSWRWGDSLDQCSGEARKHGDVKAVLLLYAFQGNLSASSCRVHQAFEDHSLNECLARHWSRSTEDLSLCGASRRCRPQFPDDELLKAVRVEELAERFQVFGETDLICTT